MTVGDLSMIKAAIIGLGWWGQHIVSTLQNKSEKIRFVRAVDLNLGASQQIAAQHSLELSSDLDRRTTQGSAVPQFAEMPQDLDRRRAQT